MGTAVRMRDANHTRPMKKADRVNRVDSAGHRGAVSM